MYDVLECDQSHACTRFLSVDPESRREAWRAPGSAAVFDCTYHGWSSIEQVYVPKGRRKEEEGRNVIGKRYFTLPTAKDSYGALSL